MQTGEEVEKAEGKLNGYDWPEEVAVLTRVF
jgi:hypothetical protein